MALIVQKYGGTSMGSIDRIKNVAKRVKRWHDNGHQVVVVVSAMSGETNRLIDLARQISTQPDPREYDQMVSTGEQVSISLLAMAIKELGIGARSMTGRQVAIKTDNAHNKARIESIDDKNIREQLDAGNIVIVAGFQGIDEEGNATTLGRGGSDTTGVAIAAALGADECQIYTDVDGVYTTDPRVTSKAKKLEKITFEEMLEMASLGSKILQIRSVEFAGKYGVPLRVLSSFDENTDGSFDQEFQDNVGTLITIDEGDNMEQAIISGIAFNRDEAKILVRGVPDHPGIASAILSPIGRANIEIDMIVQNLSDNGTTDFTFTVNRTDLDKTLKVLNEEVKDEIGAKEILGNSEVVKVSLVGVGMRSHAGVASLMFQTLAENNINIQMISTSEIKVSVLIQDQHLEKAVKSLHTAFGLDREDGESKIAGL
ncbi:MULTISPECIES: aspartate kinase [Psychrobacter]|jgi:aspartate kinase|uniref:Aspartokinase n=1 Tax=Psychrobacter nivimaris TaxID=281738 RepID=A0A6N7BVH2_9GAMM|nr:MULTISPECIES: aspartate kinase [Psychrobacter]KAF0568009.1 Aspartokinase [Psychrobacter nivimaris]KRG36447.1 aspartate kinase [Psychrobacter sp. P11G3]MBA6243824.1 aspartate kinase [Psychrobacter sp. Urea-trap-18]MBA6285407.1 aspartate kinase [Psychrobacter sp. Urea-trap-16]MBA6319073.1 aspartate kinase [Psychrobacter sp. Urea-trap-20]|tara:strand:- start:60858 stop:62144 length:1287 start_codon:yes stop_codon:yes gene_type:complete